MHIIVVGGPRSGAKTFNLSCGRLRAALGGLALGLLAVLAGFGYMLGKGLHGGALDDGELSQLRGRLLAQQGQLDATEAKARRDLDALALQIGELQAQAMRLNALGQRLTRIGKLEDGEFDFAHAPSVGGPDQLGPIDEDFLAPEFSETLGRLRAQFQAQAEQLGVLEMLLQDRDLDAEFMPAGMPVRSGFMSSGYGYRIDPFTGKRALHAGVDFNGPRGADILSVASGVVVFAGRHPAYGNMIDIDHGNGYVTRYAHNDKNLVKVGDVITGGQLIGKMGSTGRTTGSHVHFEVWHQGRPVDPRKFVSAIR